MIKNTLVTAIENHQKKQTNDIRRYIGASSIGSNCWRKIWYQFMGTESESASPKTRRTWDIGKKLEYLVVDWLVEAGFIILIDNETYKAQSVPDFQGHFDGIIYVGTEKAILEIKTAKNASFNIFVKDGLRHWNRQYFAQVQAYMGMSGITKAYMLVLNKDNSEISDELILFDKGVYDELITKAEIISKCVEPPQKVNNSPFWYECKACSFNKICHKRGEENAVN